MFHFCLLLAGSRRHFNTCCWVGNTPECKQSHRFLEWSGDYFLSQMLDRTTRRGTLLLHIHNEDPIKSLIVIANPDLTDREAVLFKMLRGVRKINSTRKCLHSRRMDFGLFREMEAVPKKWGKGWGTLCHLSLGLEMSAFKHPSSLHLLAGSGEVPRTEEDSWVRGYLSKIDVSPYEQL